MTVLNPSVPLNFGQYKTSRDIIALRAAEVAFANDELSPEAITVLMAEYDSLRNEAMTSTNNRVQIVMLGLAAIGAVAGGTFAFEQKAKDINPLIVQIIFSDAIPLLCSAVLYMWIGEALRAARAGYFIASEIERRLNGHFKQFLINWEASLWGAFLPRDEVFGPSMMAMFVFGIIAGLSPILGYVMSANFHKLLTIDSFLSFPGVALITVPYLWLFATVFFAISKLRAMANKSVLLNVFERKHAGNRAERYTMWVFFGLLGMIVALVAWKALEGFF